MGFIFSGFGIAMGILLASIFVIFFFLLKGKQKIPKVRLASDYHESNRLKGLMFDNSVHAQIATNVAGEILMFNRTAELKFGYKQEEVLGKSILILFKQANDLNWYKERMDDRSRLTELDSIHKNGEVFPVVVFIKKLDDSGFINIGWFIRKIQIDIDNRRLLQSRINFLEKGQIDGDWGTWEWNPFTNIVEVSAHMRTIFELMENEEVTAESLMECVYREDRMATAEVINNAIENKIGKYKTKYRIRKLDGNLWWIEVKGVIEYGAENVPEKIHGVICLLDVDKNESDA